MCSGKLHCLSRTKQQNRKHHPAMPVCVCARVPLSVCVWSEPATATIRGRTTRARTTSSRQENSTNKTAEKRQRKRKSKTEEQITQQTTNDKGGCNTHTHSTTQHSTALLSTVEPPPQLQPTPRPRPSHRLDADVRQRQRRGNHPKTIFGASWTTLRPPCGFMLRRCSNCSRYFCHCCWCCPFMWVDCLPWPSLIFLPPYKHINTLKQTYTYMCMHVFWFVCRCCKDPTAFVLMTLGKSLKE